MRQMLRRCYPKVGGTFLSICCSMESMSSITFNLGLPTLKTERLTLRPFTPNDLELMRALDTDADVVRFLGHGQVRPETETLKNFEKIFGDYERYGMGLYAAELSSTGEFVGRTGLIPWVLDNEDVWEVGYSLKKDHWNQGLATEAAQFWSRWGQQHLPINYLVSLIHPENISSKHVATKVGMKLWKRSQLGQYQLDVFRIDRHTHSRALFK